jgi:hypothetical protein
MWRQCLIDLVGDTCWGLYRFHRFSKSAPTPPPAPPGSTRSVSSRASLALASQPRASTFRTLLGYQLPPRAVATPHSWGCARLSSLKSATGPTKFRLSATILRSRRISPSPRQTLGKESPLVDSRTGGFSCASPSRNDGGAVTVPSGRLTDHPLVDERSRFSLL